MSLYDSLVDTGGALSIARVNTRVDDVAAAIARVGMESGCRVIATEGMELLISDGVLSNGRPIGEQTVELAAPNSTLNRVDVVQVHARTGMASVVQGDPSDYPVEPPIDTDHVKLAAVYVPVFTEPDGIEPAVQPSQIMDRRILVIAKTLVNSSYMSDDINNATGLASHNFRDLNEMEFPYYSPILFQTRNNFTNGNAFLFTCQMALGAFLMNPHTDTYGLAPGLQYSIDFAEAGDPAPIPGAWQTAPFAAYAINYAATSDFPWFQALPPFLLALQFDARGDGDAIDYTNLPVTWGQFPDNFNPVDPGWSSVDMWVSFRWSIPTVNQIFTGGTDFPVGDSAVSNIGLQAVSQLFGSTTVTRATSLIETPDGPVITTVTPATGAEAGGTAVTITGTGFTKVTGVAFGPTAGTSIVVVDDTELTCVTPAGTGAANVIVSTLYGASEADTFTYT